MADIVEYLEYQPPYRFADLLAFFGARTLEGIELVDGESYARTVRLRDAEGNWACGWLRVRDAPERSALELTASESLAPVMPQVIARVRRQFDLDADPGAVAAGLASLGEIISGGLPAGTRLPGCFDPFETSCRAVLGQQVSVKAANRMAARLVAAFGQEVPTGVEGLGFAWPSAAAVAAIPDVESAFGELGVIKTRSRTIAEIARLIEAGELDLEPGGDALEQMERLLAIKGIGPWSANYIAMRALGHGDAFLESDVGVAHALPDLKPKERLALAEQWRPWRSYAVIGLWNSLG